MHFKRRTGFDNAAAEFGETPFRLLFSVLHGGTGHAKFARHAGFCLARFLPEFLCQGGKLGFAE